MMSGGMSADILSAVPTGRFVTNAVIAAILALIVMTAVLIDLSDALYTARCTGQRIRSHTLRKTVSKLTEYWRLVLAGFMADCICCFASFYDLPYTAMLISLGLVVIEIRSLMEHAERRKSRITELPESIFEGLRMAAKIKRKRRM